MAENENKSLQVNWTRQGFQHNAGIYTFCQNEGGGVLLRFIKITVCLRDLRCFLVQMALLFLDHAVRAVGWENGQLR